MRPGEILHSGDRFQIELRPSEDLFCYIFLFTSSGSAQILFPAPDVRMNNPLHKNTVYTIPPGGFWPLDGRTGKETVFVVASRRHLRGMDRVPTEMIQATKALLSEEKRIQTAKAFLEHRFQKVEAFTFRHQ